MRRAASTAFAFAVALMPALVCGCLGPGPGVLYDPGTDRCREPEPVLHRPRRAAAPGEWRAAARERKWRYIVIHHSATEVGSAARFDREHRARIDHVYGLGYHFVIGNGRGTADGAVEVGPRWKGQRAGAHAGVQKYNSLGIGICLVGNFEKSVPTKKQREALAKLLQFLMKRFGVRPADVKRHSDIVQTKCPGKRFPWPVVKSSR